MSENFQDHKFNDQVVCSGVVGFPIEHSLSPIIHNFYLNKLKIMGSYKKFSVKIDNFEEALKYLIEKENLCGFNITLPHKERVISICHELSQSAQNIGAVNTIKILNNGKIYGHNSDADGFVANLRNQIPNYDFENKNVLVIGAGGASRAIIYALIKNKVNKIYIANRSQEKIKKIIQDFDIFSKENNVLIESSELLSRFDFLPEVDLLVNSSSLGMAGQERLDIDISNVKKSAVIYDIVYKPLYTDLLKQAQQLNLATITGIGMLIEQALIGFEMWFGAKPSYDSELEKILLK